MKSTSQRPFVLLVAFVLMTSGASFVLAQKRADVVPPQPFEAGEELVYVGEFSRSLLRKVDVADFRFTASRELQLQSHDSMPGPRPDKRLYSLKFTGDVASKGFFSKLFNLRFRQRVESIVEPKSLTVQHTKRVDEQGKRERASEAVYDSVKGEVHWTERDPRNPSRPPRTASSSFTGQIHDILSAIYYLRTQPLEVGKQFELTISDSGRVFQVPVRVVEKKRMKTVLGRVDAVRVDPQLFGPKQMLASKGELSIWLTNDSRRIPVKARIKTEYGTFDITLRKVIQNPALAEYLTKQ
jgi:hypothetical protein